MEYLGFCSEFDPSRGTKEEYDALQKALLAKFGSKNDRTSMPSTSSLSLKRKASAADDHRENGVVDLTAVGDITSTSDATGKENKKKTANESTTKRQKIEGKAQFSYSYWNKYLNALKDSGKLKKRQNAYFQMRLERWDDVSTSTGTEYTCAEEDEVCFVVKGTTNMKKILQLCAYLTGKLDTYVHDLQRGKSLVGSFCFFSNGPDGMTVLASKATKKKYPEYLKHVQSGFVEAKTVKIAQIFQGLCMSKDGGIVYDSEDAREVNSGISGSPFRICLPSESGPEFFTLVAEGILPREWSVSNGQPLPRIVGSRTAFGQCAIEMNWELQGKRKGPSFLFFGDTSQAHVDRCHMNNRFNRECNEDGHCFTPFFRDAMYKYLEKYSPPAIKTEANESEETAAAAGSAAGSKSTE